MNKNIEKRASETILQKPFSVVVGKNTYEVAPPSVATLILVSEDVAKMPQINISKSSEEIVTTVLRTAKDCKFIGNILAILILGAKKAEQKRKWWQKHNKKTALAKEILYNYSPKELQKILFELLARMEIADFFALTVSLTQINLLENEKTGETVKTTTQSGQ
jgi:hypothetical protein